MSKFGTPVSDSLCRKKSSSSPSSSSSFYKKRRRLQSTVGLIVVALGGIGETAAFVSTHRHASLPPLTRRNIPWQEPKHPTMAPTNEPMPPLHRRSTHLRSALVFPSIPVSWFYLCALAVQFGVQPLLTKAFAPSGIIRSTFVIAQDMIRFFTCWMTLVLGGTWQVSTLNWNWQGALLGAGIPSILYIIQNYFTLIAYQALPPVTFNILNQTKTLSAALCCYLLLGQKQSAVQIVALFVLLLSALVIENILPLPWTNHTSKNKVVENTDKSVSTTSEKVGKERKLAAGVVPVLIASFISGLAGAVTQKSLQNLGHNAYIFSMELSAISILIMTITLLLGSPDGKELRKSGIAKGWTWKTWIPVITNALGGVLVGLVTQHLGAVRKGFALILGLFLSGVLQSCFLSEEGISAQQILGGILASLSMWMHSRYAPS